MTGKAAGIRKHLTQGFEGKLSKQELHLDGFGMPLHVAYCRLTDRLCKKDVQVEVSNQRMPWSTLAPH